MAELVGAAADLLAEGQAPQVDEVISLAPATESAAVDFRTVRSWIDSRPASLDPEAMNTLYCTTAAWD